MSATRPEESVAWIEKVISGHLSRASHTFGTQPEPEPEPEKKA